MFGLFDEATLPLLSYQNTSLVFMFSVPFQMSENLEPQVLVLIFFLIENWIYVSEVKSNLLLVPMWQFTNAGNFSSRAYYTVFQPLGAPGLRVVHICTCR